MENTSVFEVNPNKESVIIGCIYCTLAFLILPIHFVVNTGILTSRPLRRNSLYLLMLQINLVDFGEAIFHLISGLFPIFPGIQRTFPSFVKFCGITANSLWMAMFPVMCVLSLSRVSVISSANRSTALTPIMKKYSGTVFLTSRRGGTDQDYIAVNVMAPQAGHLCLTFFNQRRARNGTEARLRFETRPVRQAVPLNGVLQILLALGWLFSLSFWLCSLVGQTMDFQGIGWGYDMSKPLSEPLSLLEYYVCFPALLLSYGTYVIIIIHLVLVRRKTTGGSPSLPELTIFFQSTFSTLYISTLIIMWHNAENWFEMTNATTCFLNCCWIFFSFLNPFLLVTLNKTIRYRVLEMLHIVKPDLIVHSIGRTSSVNVSRSPANVEN